jgi:hypothetical protein
MKKKLIILVLSFMLFTLTFVSAENYIVSNSANWKDVYSSLMYANLRGIESDFLVSQGHGPILLEGIDKAYNLLIISSKDTPLIFDYLSLAEEKGFSSVEEIQVSSANLELIDKLRYIENFIIVEDSYGYNAMAVVAYALATDSWVFLTDKTNIDYIESILDSRNVNNLLLYGYLDSEITERLSKYNPEIIDSGDKFQNNIEIVKKYGEVGSISQVILGNGEFIEKEIMQGKNALILIEEDSVPSKTIEYIKSSDIEMAVLIGNELIEAATNIRQSTGINVQVKFARSARERTSGVSPVEGLDLIYISSSPEPKKQKIVIQEEPPETVEYTTTEVTTKSTDIQIPPGNKQIITGEAISEQESNSKNSLLFSSLIIGIAIIIGFVVLAFILKKSNHYEQY